MSVDEGYYFTADNFLRAADRYGEWKAWTDEQRLVWDAVGLDIEPDVRLYQQIADNPWGVVPMLLPRIWQRERPRRAAVAYAGLVARIRADGWQVENYQFPLIADERRAGSDLLQRLAGLVEVSTDREVWMLYSSFLRSVGPGMIWSYGPEASAIAVGSTGGVPDIPGHPQVPSLGWDERLSRGQPNPGRFDPVMAAGLPEPACRWLTHAIVPGTRRDALATARPYLQTELRVGPDGDLRSVVMPRWGDPDGRAWGEYPCGGILTGEVDFGGIRLPTQMRAGWFFGTDHWAEGEFFRAQITTVTLQDHLLAATAADAHRPEASSSMRRHRPALRMIHAPDRRLRAFPVGGLPRLGGRRADDRSPQHERARPWWPDGPVSDSVQGPDAADGQVRGVRFIEPRGGSVKRATILVPVG